MKEIEETLFELHRLFVEIKPGDPKPELHEKIQESLARARLFIQLIDDITELDKISTIMNSIVTVAVEKLDSVKGIAREIKQQDREHERRLKTYLKDLRQQGVPPESLKAPEKLEVFLSFLDARIKELEIDIKPAMKGGGKDERN